MKEEFPRLFVTALILGAILLVFITVAAAFENEDIITGANECSRRTARTCTLSPAEKSPLELIGPDEMKGTKTLCEA